MPATASLAWGLSVLALVVLDLEGTSSLALVLLPWVALAGMPQRLGSSPRPGARGARRGLTSLGLALPILGLAAAQDLVLGALPGTVLVLALSGLLLVGGQAAAAGLAARERHEPAAGAGYGAAWCLLIPLPALASAAALLGAAGPDPVRGVLRGLLDAAPVAFVLGRARAGAAAEGLVAGGVGALLVVALLLFVGLRDARR